MWLIGYDADPNQLRRNQVGVQEEEGRALWEVDVLSFIYLRVYLICIAALYYIVYLYNAKTCCNIDTGSVAEPTLPPASLSVERMSAFVKPSLSIDAFYSRPLSP